MSSCCPNIFKSKPKETRRVRHFQTNQFAGEDIQVVRVNSIPRSPLDPAVGVPQLSLGVSVKERTDNIRSRLETILAPAHNRYSDSPRPPSVMGNQQDNDTSKDQTNYSKKGVTRYSSCTSWGTTWDSDPSLSAATVTIKSPGNVFPTDDLNNNFQKVESTENV